MAKSRSKKTARKAASKKTAKKSTRKSPTRKSAASKSSKKVAKKMPTKKSAASATKKKAASKKASTTKKSVSKKKTTKKKTTKKKTTAAPAAASGKSAKTTKKKSTAKAPRPKKPKPALSAKEMRQYRDLLLLKRAEILGDMSTMSEEALRNHDSANLSHMPLHMADVGSDNYEQELMLGLVESERKMVFEINEALVRIAEKTYGTCEATGKPIGKARLAAKPWAKYCIEYARQLEGNGRGHFRR